MSTANPPAGAVPTNHPETASPVKKIDYLIVYGHSNLFYWWPVWLVSFILAGLTYSEGNLMAVVPRGAEVEHNVVINGQPHDVLVAPPGSLVAGGDTGRKPVPRMTVTRNNSLGVIFVATLLVVALASTILLRGLVS